MPVHPAPDPRHATMEHRIWIDILPQPNLSTCGPTCLHAVYRYFGDDQSLEEVIGRIATNADGGTLAVLLAIDALARGFGATIHTFNLHVFDPTWFHPEARVDLPSKLRAQAESKRSDERLQFATLAYLEFLERGGQIDWGDLTPNRLGEHLTHDLPVLTGLSSTYLYQEAREIPVTGTADDVAGTPSGHFVILSGFDRRTSTVRVADPLDDNPVGPNQHYVVSLDRVICSILLGVLTYDANFLVLHPKPSRHRPRATSPVGKI